MSTVTLIVEVPEYWIDDMVLNVDVFRTTACGYWARGLEYDEELGWLVWEVLESSTAHTDHSEALYAWRKGEKLPPNYHCFDRQLAIDAFGQLVLLRGQGPVPDARETDCAIQRVLFGEERYG